MGGMLRAIAGLRDQGLNARWALTVCDRAYVLETGSIVKQGTSQELMQDMGARRRTSARNTPSGPPNAAPSG